MEHQPWFTGIDPSRVKMSLVTVEKISSLFQITVTTILIHQLENIKQADTYFWGIKNH